MSSARVAFVSPRFPEEGVVGGAETLLWKLACHAASAGLLVSYLTTCARDHGTWENSVAPGHFRREGVDVFRFPIDPDRDRSLHATLLHRITQGHPLSREEERIWMRQGAHSRALLDHAEQASYDLFVAGPYLFGTTFGILERFPERALLVPCLHKEPFARLEIVRDMFRKARGVLFNSPEEQDLATRWMAPQAPGHVIGLGFDERPLPAGGFATARGIATPYVISCGRREASKGTPLLLDYFATFVARTERAVSLVLSGSGTIAESPHAKGRIVDVGVLSEEDKGAALADALALVHASRAESLGIVVLEAFLAETPAVVHDGCAPLRGLVQRAGAGLTFRNYPEFESVLAWLLDHREAAATFGKAGRRFVLENHSWARIGPRLLLALSTP